MITHYILFKNIHIDKANSISSPITYGFPSIAGFLGTIHALKRKVNALDLSIDIKDHLLIACSHCQPYLFKPSSYSDASFIQERNPLRKDGKTASIIEEGKVNLVVSLIIPIEYPKKEIDTNLIQSLKELLMQQRMAGGHIKQIEKAKHVEKEDLANLKIHLAPAYILTEADEDMIDIIEELQTGIKKETEEPTGLPPNPDANALDVLLACATNYAIPHTEEHEKTSASKSMNNRKKNWQNYNIKTGRGWLVPMPVGYQGISQTFPPHEVDNVRNPEYPTQYVESVYTLGKWVFPLRIADGDLEKHFWRYQEPTNDLYLISTVN